jgi:RNA polymerase sigma-70 factor (ECF subfamily)
VANLRAVEAVMSADDSFVKLMVRLRNRDDDAAAAVFHRYAARLIALARSRLGPEVRQKVDPEDVLQSVYRSFFVRQQDGQIDLEGWDNLWSMLALITLRKCANQVAHFRAECRDVRREVGAGPQADPVCEVLSGDPSPSEAAVLTEVVEQVLHGLEGRDREIVTLHLQGYSIPEISAQVEWAERTVHRILERVRKRLRHMQEG